MLKLGKKERKVISGQCWIVLEKTGSMLCNFKPGIYCAFVYFWFCAV